MRLPPIALFMPVALLLAQTWSTRPPRIIARTEPQYSEEARRAGVSTTITVSLVVNENGVPEDIRVVRGAGFGLDEMAVRAIETWRFEPAIREGKPFKTSSRVEMHFNLPDKAHADQTARLHFDLPPGLERPQLIQGKIPANPDPPGEAVMRLRFTVNPDGSLQNLQTLETDNPEWTAHALHEIAGWRFRPAMANGQPVEVRGIFELMFSPQAPGNRPTLQRSPVPITPSEPLDTSLPAPKLIAPPDNARFDGYPRRVTCKWEAVPGASSYLLEWDYMDRGAWNAEAQGIPGTALATTGTEYTFDFVGAQPGRWRVWPVNLSGQRGNPSEWRTFRFLH